MSGPPHESETTSPPMPAWAWPRVVALSDARAEEVRTSGVRVIGDPDWLRVEAPDDRAAADEAGAPETVASDAVALGVAEMFERVVERERRAKRGARARAARTRGGSDEPGLVAGLARRLRRG